MATHGKHSSARRHAHLLVNNAVRCDLRSIVLVLSLAGAGMVVQSCMFMNSEMRESPPPPPQRWAAGRSLTFTNPGSPGVGQITVTVYGEVKTPGIFMMKEGATVKDALMAAGGLMDFFKWGLSGITRANGTFVNFDPRHRAADEQLRLYNGDSLYISRLVN